MRKLFTVLSLVSVSMLHALEWKSYDAAVAEAMQEGKIIMIDAVRTGCHYCDDMQAEVFYDPEASAWIEERFIPVKVNISEEEMPLGITVGMTPTFYFIDPMGTIIKRIPGAWHWNDFKSMLEGIK